jgi:hypothetical protein
MEKIKEKHNDISFKTSRLWKNKNIRNRYNKLMADDEKKIDTEEVDFCKEEREQGTVVFPAIEILDEFDNKNDATCIDTNRNELLKAFCSFSKDLDNLFGAVGKDLRAKTFWPNICCKERNGDGESLVKCNPPQGINIKPENMIPFALSQGGDFNHHNLYAEVTKAIKENGYIHEGMKKLLREVHQGNEHKAIAMNLINKYFEEVKLCGPRIIDAPRSTDDKKLCELFVPYHHSMKNFYKLIERMYTRPLNEPVLFIETMGQSLLARQLSSKKNRLGKDGLKLMQNTLNTKPNQNKQKDLTCKKTKNFVGKELKLKKKKFCKGSNHLDLSNNNNVRNIAIYYLENELSEYYKENMISLKEQIRYDVKDTTCPSKLFDAKDISIQEVSMDTNGAKKELVAVVNLNDDANGYLQSELPKCKIKDYLIELEATVTTYIDSENCCDDVRDYNQCVGVPACKGKLKKLKDKNNNDFKRVVELTGSDYSIVDPNTRNRRRRLLVKVGHKADSRL